jgi:ATP-binding protein involved in chromosome partitioning
LSILARVAGDDAITPTAIRQDGPRALAIEWADGHRSRYDVRELRLACGCAHCVDEWTGEGRLDPAGVPEDVHPVRVERVGRYAIQIEWSDGHASGIYPFRRLRELG